MTTGLRERKKQRRRETIVRVALELFAERGFHGTTVADIADAAEISKGTLFAYFPSKEAILFADAAVLRDELAAAFAERPAGTSTLDVLRAFHAERIGLMAERTRLRERLVEEDEQLRSHYRARFEAVAELVAASIAEELDETADDLRSRLVAATVVAALTAAVEHPQSRDRSLAVIDETIAFLRGGLDAVKSYPNPY